MANEHTRNAFFTGRKSAIGTSAVRLTTQDILAKKGVLIYADSANSAVVYAGESNVTADSSDTTDGFPIPAGKALQLDIDNPNKVFVVSTASSQKVWWMVV